MEFQFKKESTNIFSQVYKKINDNFGSLYLRTLASKNNSSMSFPEKTDLTDNIVLDLEYSTLIPIKNS